MTREKTEAQSFPFDATRKARRPSAINVDDSVSRFHVQNEGDSDRAPPAPFRSAPRTTLPRLLQRTDHAPGQALRGFHHLRHAHHAVHVVPVRVPGSVAVSHADVVDARFLDTGARCRRRGTRTRSPPRRTSGSDAHLEHRAGRGHVHRVLHDPARVRDGRRARVVDPASVAGESVDVSRKRFSALFDGVRWRVGGGQRVGEGNRGRTSRARGGEGCGIWRAATRHTSTGVVMSSRATRRLRENDSKVRCLYKYAASVGAPRPRAWAKKFVLSRTSRVSSRFVGGSFPGQSAHCDSRTARASSSARSGEKRSCAFSPVAHARATSAPVAVGALAVNC